MNPDKVQLSMDELNVLLNSKKIYKNKTFFMHLRQNFSSSWKAKLKDGVFTELNSNVPENDLKWKIWVSFKEVIYDSLCNNKDRNEKEIAKGLMRLRCTINSTFRILICNFSPENIVTGNKEQNERFYENIKDKSERTRWDVSTIADNRSLIYRNSSPSPPQKLIGANPKGGA